MISDDKCEYVQKLQKVDLFNFVTNKIYRYDIIKENNIKFNSNVSIGEDLRFNLCYIEYAKKMVFLNKILYIYEMLSNGLNSIYFKNMIYVKLENVKIEKKMFKKFSGNIRYINNLYVLTCLSGLSNIVKNVSKEEALSDIKKFKNNKEVQNELNDIKNSKDISFIEKIIIKFLKNKNIILTYYLSKMTIILKKIYRRIFIE